MPEYLTATAISAEKARREAVLHCGLALGLTWLPHVGLALSGRPYSSRAGLSAGLNGLGLAGPTVAALAIEAHVRDVRGVRALAHAASFKTTSPWRLVAAVGAQPAIAAIAGVFSKGRRSEPVDPAMVIGQVWVVVGEEFGWRGFLLPRLRRVMPPAAAVVVMSLVWGGWHLPMFFVNGSPQRGDGVLHFASAMFAWSAVHHLLQIGRPSVATAMVFHAMANLATSVVKPRHRAWLTVAYLAAGVAATYAVYRREFALALGRVRSVEHDSQPACCAIGAATKVGC